MGRIVSDEALDTLFRAARSPVAWLPRPVGDTLLRALWELVKLGPGSGGGPASMLFVKSDDAKVRLAAALPTAMRAVLADAPVIAIIGCPFDGAEHRVALREVGLQAAWLILAARALGLDCLPVWEFDAAAVDAAFFPAGKIAADFLCALGQGDDARPALGETRTAASEACQIL